MKNILAILGNINASDVLGGLTLIQIIVFFVCVALAIVVGLLVGACIFFPAGVKSCLKQIQKKKAEKLAGSENKQVENIVAQEEKHNVSQNSSLNYTEDDYLIDDDDILDDDILDDEILDEDFTAETAQMGGDNSDINRVVYGDKDYMALVEKRKREIPVMNRNYLVNKLYSMDVVSEKINIEVHSPSEQTPYVRVTAGGCTFMYIFVKKKVMKLFLRLHNATFTSIKDRAGDLIKPCADFGDDWYSLIVSDFPKVQSIATNIIDLSYRYTAQMEFENSANGVVYKGVSYEDKVKAVADDYNPYEDKEFGDEVERLLKKYKLSYFGKSESCACTRKLVGKEKPSAIEFVGNRPAILKAGEVMFGIVFENYGVVKFIFRNSDKYFKDLAAKHDFVKESDFPKSDDWQWYSLLLDGSYSDKEIKQIIQDSYNYVINFNETAELNTDIDVDVDV